MTAISSDTEVHAAFLPVLLYHRLSDSIGCRRGDLEVSIAAFDEHMSALHEYGWHGIGLSEAFARFDRGQPLDRCVAITFDDAFAGFDDLALPVLRRVDWSATMYVPTAHVGGRAEWIKGALGRERLLGWPELGVLRDAGIEIGSHGHRHHPFDVAADATIRDELARSRDLIHERLGVDARTFAYPNGYSSRSSRDAVRAAGFTSACVIGHARQPIHGDRLTVRRLLVRGQHSAAHLLRLVDGRAARAEHFAKQAAAAPWRQVRKARRFANLTASPKPSSTGASRRWR
jgi:peptidoglycan/xylan/chitin deacetylase (PgdA/CDA1 family)